MEIPSTKIQISNKYQAPKFKTVSIIADDLLNDEIVSVIIISDLDIIWDLGFEIWDLSLFSENQIIFRTYYDVTLLDILAPQRYQSVHHHSGKPGHIFRR